ncbi:MAG: nucleotidyltransferase domain-containing protein [Defluviitaleaceae bacterium]|nr:nucleotidyltransferase domain-containing protein [Defluviitaleaceae bacterium]
MLDKAKVGEIAETYTAKVREVYDPKQVILFGSHINGSPHEDSDIDIAVVFDTIPEDFLGTWTHLIKLRRGLSFNIETHMLDEVSDRSGFLEHIRNTGEVLYESIL